MSLAQPSGEDDRDLDDFKWGIHMGVGRKNKDINFYESFVYEGVEYFLYDCAYFHHDDRPETSVGKLVQLYERPTHEKVVKVVWFFRPSEIRNFLGDYRPSWNELFLASGVGKGLSNINLVESIVEKCNVVCTSRDKRNPEPSERDLKTADFFFNCAFDVGTRSIVDNFADEIGGIEVGNFFNRKGKTKPSNILHVGTNTRPKIAIETRTVLSDSLLWQVEDNAEVKASKNIALKSSSHSFLHKKRKTMDDYPTIGQSGKSPEDKEFDEKGEKLRQSKRDITCLKVTKVAEGADGLNVLHKDESSLQSFPLKKGMIVDKKLANLDKHPKDEDFEGKMAKFRQENRVETLGKTTEVTNRSDARKNAYNKSTNSQSGKSLGDKEFDENGAKLRHDKRAKLCGKVTEVTERPDAERRRWFKKLDWDQRLREAQEKDTLVLLYNLDPSYSSNEVEDLVWHALKKKVEARVVEHRLDSSNYYGKALVIFNTKDAAEFAISELRRRCLILGDGRIVSAKKGTLAEPGTQCRFTGHFSIDKFVQTRQRMEMRNAVSTSHCSQSNNIEYDMAVEWILRNKKSDACWEALNKKQMKEIEHVKKKFKMDRDFL